MFNNPFITALGASAYIFLVVGIMNYVSHMLRDKPDTFLAPLTALFMLTLSVAVMAYCFFYQPLQLFIEGKKKEALQFFVRTVGIFSIFTAVVLIFLLSGIIKK